MLPSLLSYFFSHLLLSFKSKLDLTNQLGKLLKPKDISELQIGGKTFSKTGLDGHLMQGFTLDVKKYSAKMFKV